MSRAVLITGGSRGIGFAIARAFIGAGDRVTITGRESQRLAEAGAMLGARAVVADATDPEAIAPLRDLFADGIDVIVNNAGGFTGTPPAAGSPLATIQAYWLAGLRVNLLGAVLTVAAMEDRIRPGGTVVSIGSIGAEYAANPYSAAKAALAAWNAGLSERLGERDITANVISPGYVEATDLFGGRMTEERRDALVARTHLKRPGRPTDVAALAVFLASPGARHLTGQTLHLNGGAFTTR